MSNFARVNSQKMLLMTIRHPVLVSFIGSLVMHFFIILIILESSSPRTSLPTQFEKNIETVFITTLMNVNATSDSYATYYKINSAIIEKNHYIPKKNSEQASIITKNLNDVNLKGHLASLPQTSMVPDPPKINDDNPGYELITPIDLVGTSETTGNRMRYKSRSPNAAYDNTALIAEPLPASTGGLISRRIRKKTRIPPPLSPEIGEMERKYSILADSFMSSLRHPMPSFENEAMCSIDIITVSCTQGLHMPTNLNHEWQMWAQKGRAPTQALVNKLLLSEFKSEVQ